MKIPLRVPCDGCKKEELIFINLSTRPSKENAAAVMSIRGFSAMMSRLAIKFFIEVGTN